LINIDNFFNNDVITLSLVININSSTAQEIENWSRLPTGAFAVHTADMTQLDFAVGKFV